MQGPREATTIDLRARKRVVLETWQREIRQQVAGFDDVSAAALGAPVETVFDQLADWLADSLERVATLFAAVDAHAAQRFRHGVPIDMLVREYACLRQCMAHELAGDSTAVLRLDQVIDIAIAYATKQYLQLREELRERFVGVLAHDLRNPLACVTMASEMLGDAPRTAQERKHLALIVDASDRMQRMVGEVLAWARGNFEGFAITRRPEDLGEIVSQVIAEAHLIHRDSTVTFDASGDLHGELDRDRVHQAISNLLRNAIEHGTGCVHVQVTEVENGRALILAVRNRGALRSPHSSDVTDPFRRRRRPTSSRGLGLYIVDQVARGHGATLDISSTLEETTITIRWPTRRGRHERPDTHGGVAIDDAR